MKETDSKTQLENFLYNIAFLRKYYGYPKTKMSKILGIGTKTLSKIESGILPPRLDAKVFLKTKIHFGISVNIMFLKRISEKDINTPI